MKKILGSIRKAVEEYGMIKENDKISVGLSGGKDSIVLLYALKLYQNFSPIKYELEAITIDNGFEGFDLLPVKQWCINQNIPYTIQSTDIGKIVFDIRKESNPCSLCAKMRRGALHNTMKKNDSNILALGHHSDDAIETLFMSLLYTGQMKTIPPITHLSQKNIWVIRPMIYATESEVSSAQRKHELPIVSNPCPVDKTTTREKMKTLTHQFYKDIPNSRANIISAMKNKDQSTLWFKADMKKR